jgi:hypothetical protein
MEEQAVDYTEEIGELKATIASLRESMENEQAIPDQVKSRLESLTDRAEQAEEDALLKFLNSAPTWGYTAARIRTKSAEQDPTGPLANVATSRIRTIAARLISKGQVRTRMSKNNNVLYQANA